jgi:EAL domain-containing protein (putative c-di-GMP-specific phosphodiesterase class I)
MRHILSIEPNLVKLDISLTRGIDRDRKRHALASALIAFARETDVQTIAEGVETAAATTLPQTVANLGSADRADRARTADRRSRRD